MDYAKAVFLFTLFILKCLNTVMLWLFMAGYNAVMQFLVCVGTKGFGKTWC